MKVEYVIQKTEPHKIVVLDKTSNQTIDFQPKFLKRWYELGWVNLDNPELLKTGIS
jgi:hypothetical protein